MQRRHFEEFLLQRMQGFALGHAFDGFDAAAFGLGLLSRLDTCDFSVQALVLFSIDDFRGRLSQLSAQDPAAFERLNYIRVLDTYSFKPGVWS